MAASSAFEPAMSAESIALHLNKSRQALLDLSTRNRLLSLPQRASSKLLNFYDELTPEIYRLLVADGKSLGFLPGRVSQPGGAPGEAAEPADDNEEISLALPQPEDDEPDQRGVASRHRDLKLQTRLSSERLQHNLLEMYYDAKTFVEEQGVNILFLALGQLQWRDKNAPDKERFAPLILLPVKLERKSAAERFNLSWLQEDAAENLSLAAKMKADFGLLLPEFKSGDDFDPAEYLAQVSAAVASQTDWEVQPHAMTLGFFSFAKFLMYRDLDIDTWPEAQRLDQQPLIAATLQDGFPAQPPLFPEDVQIDSLIPVASQRHVVDADSSQSLAIEAVRKGQNLVIQGPPGTGKSQTITNVIAAAIADGKKVLFISEKMAALEVVHRRLSAIGLGPACLELHSHHSNKRRVLEELKATCDLGKPRLEQREQIIKDLSSTQQTLNQHCDLMHQGIEPSSLTPYQVIGHLAELQHIRLTHLPPLLEQPEDWSDEDFQSRRLLVQQWRQTAEKLGPAATHPWRGVGLPPLLKLDADQLLQTVPVLEQQWAQLQVQAGQLAIVLSLPAAPSIQALQAQIALAQQLGSAPVIDQASVANAIWAHGLSSLQKLVKLGQELHQASAWVTQNFVDSAWNSDLEPARQKIAAHGDSLFRILISDYRQALNSFKSHLKAALPKTLAERLALLDQLIAAQKLRRAVAQLQNEGQAAFGALWRGEESNWQQLQAVVTWMAGQDGQGRSQEFRQLYARLPSPQQCAQQASQVQGLLTHFEQAAQQVLRSYQLDLQEAFQVTQLADVPLADLGERLAQWRARPEALFDWTQYHATRERIRAAGLSPLAQQLELQAIEAAQLPTHFERAYYEHLLRSASQRAPELAAFNGEQHNSTVERFRELDKNRIALARAESALSHFEQIPRASAGIGPMGALNGEIARKRGHMSLRKLFKIAGEAVQAIKPVFMMSPLSVAQFLEPGAVEFDMLVIDEASQIEPIDALGAIARCKQLVVVGDERQLPPTRFFSRMTTESEVDEEDDDSYVAGAGDVESILSLCIAKGMPQLMLRWHYRSRHQSLIAVSNQQFYQNALYIVPSPYTAVSGMGLRFHHLPEGRFDSGGTRVNKLEAQTIAQAIIAHALNNRQQSLGVAAFSLQQKVAIQTELELLRRANPEAEAFFTDHPNEPFFIKNLENVQGDERDVIFISVAYARNASGQLPMRFGPVSLDGGERRLNVLISRAKLRCEVFSSITAEDIDLERGKGKGVAALKVFLSYAQTGRLSLAGPDASAQHSPLEQQVLQALTARGLTVHPNIGIAGLFIDLAVVDAEHNERYLLGIECDGSNYRAARSARDRDRLRQSVLQDHGWILHRVWGFDWFRQPEAEVEKIMAAVEAAKIELAERNEQAQRSQANTAPVQINFIDREQQSEVSLSQGQGQSLNSASYTEAKFAVPSGQDIHALPTTALAQLVLQVVEAEGPVHFDEVVTRIRTLWGLQRAGSRIREALERAKQALIEQSAIALEGDYLDICDRTVRVRDRSAVSSSALKKAECLPPAEVRTAIKTALKDNLGGQRDELPAAVGKMLGLSVINAQVKELVCSQLDALHAAGEVQLHGNTYRIEA